MIIGPVGDTASMDPRFIGGNDLDYQMINGGSFGSSSKTDNGLNPGGITGATSPSGVHHSTPSTNDINHWINYLRTEADGGNSAAVDMLFNYIASETSAKTARDWTAQREDTQYQRLMDDLRKSGISPYILSSALPGTSSAKVQSYSGSQMTQRETNLRSNEYSLIEKIISTIGSTLGSILGAEIIGHYKSNKK